MVHSVFKILKLTLPNFLSDLLRSFFTAILTPISFSIRSGHFISSFKKSAFDQKLNPIPWYTYPSINFLETRSFSDKTVLEFGGGQSSIWWGLRAKNVVTLEGDHPVFSPTHEWAQKLKKSLPRNVELHEISMKTSESCQSDVINILKNKPFREYDVIIIDGLYRSHMIPIAIKYMSSTGMIIVDNADRYDIFEGFEDSDLMKIEFYGYTPGVYLKSCTCIYFGKETTFLNSDVAINIPR